MYRHLYRHEWRYVNESRCTSLDNKKPAKPDNLRVSYTSLTLIESLNGGERGVRTLDTLPYTHFPGVRLRPLGHLSFIRLPVDNEKPGRIIDISF